MLYLIAIAVFAVILAADVITGRTDQRPPAPYSPGPNSDRKRPGRTPATPAPLVLSGTAGRQAEREKWQLFVKPCFYE